MELNRGVANHLRGGSNENPELGASEEAPSGKKVREGKQTNYQEVKSFTVKGSTA